MTTHTHSLGVTLVLVAALLLPSAAVSKSVAGPNLIVNGCFEQPVVGVGSYKLVSTGQSFSGWRAVGAPGAVAAISGTYMEGGFKFDAKSGHQWIDMTGLSNTATGVAQTVKTKPGGTYKLTFSVGNVVDPGGLFGTESTVNVLVNGYKLLAATSGGSKTQAWKTFTVTVKATSAATTIEFLNGDKPADNDNGLDAVSLTSR